MHNDVTEIAFAAIGLTAGLIVGIIVGWGLVASEAEHICENGKSLQFDNIVYECVAVYDIDSRETIDE